MLPMWRSGSPQDDDRFYEMRSTATFSLAATD
jgi:hypothetical protein